MQYTTNGYTVTLDSDGWVFGGINSTDLLCLDCAENDRYADSHVQVDEEIDHFIAVSHGPEHPPMCQYCEQPMTSVATEA